MHSPEVKQLFVEMYKKRRGHISETCDLVGVCRRTYYEWRAEDADFREKIEAVEEGFLDSAEQLLRSKVEDEDDANVAMFLLRTIGKRRGYSVTTEIEHKNLTAPTIHILLAPQTDKTIDITAEDVKPDRIEGA